MPRRSSRPPYCSAALKWTRGVTNEVVCRAIRAIGIIRQSKGREEALSPAEQRLRIAEYCEREGFELVEVQEEIDVSGGTPLDRREGLREAVCSIEGGGADTLVVAYFDRLVRSLTVQEEVVSRVEAAGGRVLAVDFGEITGRSAVQWLSGTMLGAVSEYYRRSVRERSGEAQAMAIAEGRVPFPNIPPGYEKQEGKLVPSELAPVVAEAFRMRAEGEVIAEVRRFLAEAGVVRSYHGVQSMLGSRIYLGELHFGGLVNTEAHEPIVSREVWQRAQRPPRGRRAKSDRLLARLGVLQCGTCGSRMVVGTSNNSRYPIYRCPPVGDCPRRVTIGAHIAENFAIEQTKQALRGMEGRASAEREAREAEAALEQAQADLEAALRAFTGLTDEAAATERLRELRAARDAAGEAVEHLGRLRAARTVDVGEWGILTLDEQRGLIRATLERIEVAPGRGDDRLSRKLLV